MPVGIGLSLALYSLVIGWNLLTTILFWFIMVPLLAHYLPLLISRRDLQPNQSILGLVLFYAIMVVMIYDHFQSDYFMLMIASLLINLGTISLIRALRKQNRLVANH